MRIAIANDSLTAAEALRRAVAASPHQVAWIARTGLEAVRLCTEQPPDLVLMDLAMPQLDGVEAIRRIMREAPCAILVVTAAPQDNVGQVFRARGGGALDVVATPVLGGAADGAAPLLAKIRTIGVLVGVDKTRKAALHGAQGTQHAPAMPETPLRRLVAIGASTGGPVALARLLGEWRPPADTAVVVVQHIDAAFAVQLARWLGEQTGIPVRTIDGGAALEGGTVLVAASGDHLRLAPDGRLHYDSDPRAAIYRPSIDVFFGSVARHWKRAATGILLTGMGRDGAAGLLALRQAGHATVAQDEASSAVYGMPRAAATLGAAERILPLSDIAAYLSGTIAPPPSRRG
jgi:two-component system response regulator WspF